MNEKEIQDLTPEQMLFICSLAIRKIRTDIAFLKSKVNREDSLRSVDKTAYQLIDCGILQGLIQAENAFHDVYYSGIWKTSGGAVDDKKFILWLDRQCSCCSPGDIYVKFANRSLLFCCADCGKVMVVSGSLLTEHLEQIFDLLVMADKERGASYEE